MRLRWSYRKSERKLRPKINKTIVGNMRDARLTMNQCHSTATNMT